MGCTSIFDPNIIFIIVYFLSVCTIIIPTRIPEPTMKASIIERAHMDVAVYAIVLCFLK